MAILWDALVRPDDLTTFMRNVPVRQEYVLNQIFPDRMIQDEEVTLRDVTLTQRTAKFRAYDAPPAPGKRDTFTRRSVKLPAISQMLSSGEVDRRRLAIAQARGRSDAALLQAIYDDAQNNVESIQNRIELTRGDLLNDGKVTIDENGVTIEADFGVPGGQIVTTSTSWANPSADILGDIRTWVQSYRAVTGYRPGSMVMSEDIYYYMLKNTAIKNLYVTQGVAAPFLSQQQVAATLQTYGLPPVKFTYDAQVSVDGVSTAVLPQTKVWFLPPDGTELGYTAWGLTVTGQEIANTGLMTYEAAAGIVGVIDKNPSPPYRETVYADASALPVLSNPRALMIATVLI